MLLFWSQKQWWNLHYITETELQDFMCFRCMLLQKYAYKDSNPNLSVLTFLFWCYLQPLWIERMFNIHTSIKTTKQNYHIIIKTDTFSEPLFIICFNWNSERVERWKSTMNLKIHLSLKAHNLSYNPKIKNLLQCALPHILHNMVHLSIVCCDVLSLRCVWINPHFFTFLHFHSILCHSLPPIHAKIDCICDLQDISHKKWRGISLSFFFSTESLRCSLINLWLTTNESG